MILVLHTLVSGVAASTATCAAFATTYGAFSATADAACYAKHYAEGNNATHNDGDYDWPSIQRKWVENERVKH